MGKRDKGVDAYIAKSGDFAKPILTHLRELVHQACPEVEEKLKWSCPHFDYKGPFCNMAAFKNHCAFGIWKAMLIPEVKGKVTQMGSGSMGHFGQLKSLKDLPGDKVLTGYLKKAMALNDAGIKTPARTKTGEAKKEVSIPAELTAALKKNKKALEVWKAFSPSKIREYADWVADAKTDATREKRLTDAVAWISEGKSRHWKYQTK